MTNNRFDADKQKIRDYRIIKKTLDEILQEGENWFENTGKLFRNIFSLKEINGKVKRRKPRQKIDPF